MCIRDSHQGDYDIPLMLLYLDEPHGLVAQVETKKIPLVRTWMELLDCVFIDRDSPRKAMEAMRQAQTMLEQGKSMVVFPEGTRSRGDQMNEFKAGAFRMACKAGAVSYTHLDVYKRQIEDQAQVRRLRACGCDSVQGYVFSKPVPPEEFEQNYL